MEGVGLGNIDGLEREMGLEMVMGLGHDLGCGI